MNYSDLKSFFEGQTDAATLQSMIQDEVADYKYNLQNKKRNPVTINDTDDEYFILDKPHFEMLSKAYLDGVIDQYDLFYIGDSVQASDNFDFKDRQIADLFAHISDIGANGPINQKIMMGLVDGLK